MNRGGYVVTDCPRSQKQADIWYFGQNAGIDFRSGTAVPLLDEYVMTSIISSAVISDSLGNILFFTDGLHMWDRGFNLLGGAVTVNGNPGVTQPCIIVPQPGDSNLYYLFTIDVINIKPDNSYTTKGLQYSVIDMNKNNGNGDTTKRLNIPLLTPVSQKITAVKDANKKDFWVIVHMWDSDEFDAYLLTEKGLADPVSSHVGTVQGTGFAGKNNAVGYLKASPDGKMLAQAVSGKNLIELFDFNNNTGSVSNVRSYTNSIPGITPYGIEFSSDSRKLYASLLQIGGSGPPTSPSRIFQFDLNNGITNPVQVDSTFGVRLGGMQLATDGRIYIARTINYASMKDSLDVIYNPTRPGTDCNYNSLDHDPTSRFSLEGRKSIFGLPNFVQSYFDRPIFTHDSVCHGDVTQFNIINKANLDNVAWDFGDGTTSNVLDPVHQYASPGNYTVKLTESWSGKLFTDSSVVTVHPLPNINLGDTILLFSGASILLHAGGGYQHYLWSTGSADSVITVSSGGDYWARVEDEHCCYNLDTVHITQYQYFFPNAFTPNGDGTNDIFRAVGLYRNIKFSMYIYDRWGQLVFESANIDQGWDGTFGGQACPSNVYVYICNIEFLGTDIKANGKIVYKGTVTLVR
jgi:gliding motility-associated-like protein